VVESHPETLTNLQRCTLYTSGTIKTLFGSARFGQYWSYYWVLKWRTVLRLCGAAGYWDLWWTLRSRRWRNWIDGRSLFLRIFFYNLFYEFRAFCVDRKNLAANCIRWFATVLKKGLRFSFGWSSVAEFTELAKLFHRRVRRYSLPHACTYVHTHARTYARTWKRRKIDDSLIGLEGTRLSCLRQNRVSRPRLFWMASDWAEKEELLNWPGFDRSSVASFNALRRYSLLHAY
jgi:hypothetical protein